MKWFYFLLVLVPVYSQYLNSTGKPESIKSDPCSDRYHLFLAPGVLTAGGTNRACISRFYPEGPARMLVTLLSEDKQTTTASRELPAGDGGCVDITVPMLPNTKADMVVNLRYPEAQCSWERRITLRISSGRVVMIHTERARYRPGETLRFRLFALKADLTPAHGQIDEIWVEGPPGAWEGSRVAQWSRVRTRLGLAQLQHDLDDMAPPGKWTVRARLGDGSQGSATFWVGNYELPPFQLSVRHAPRVLRTSERLIWTVCVRYPWTEAVEGMLVIRLRGAGAAAGRAGGGGVRTAVRLRAPRACHRHAVAARRIGLGGPAPPDVVVADFSFQEEGTKVWQNTTVVSQVVEKPISLEFLTKHRAVISPGLPYKIKVKATRWDDKPASDERVRVCRFPANIPIEPDATVSQSDATCVDAATDTSGVARVMFAAGDDSSPFYRFEASVARDESARAGGLVLAARRGARGAALGPLRAAPPAPQPAPPPAPPLVPPPAPPPAPPRGGRALVPLYLSLGNVSAPLTVHFVVITRGGVIYRWGATTQCPLANSANQIRTAARDSQCNDAMSQYEPMPENNDASDTLLDRHLLRVMLPIKITHQMCPDSHLVAYFYYNGEFVSASKHFEMEECFVNKVEATWLSRQTLPGSITSLQVSTPGPALCALTALDTSAKWSQPPQTVKEVLMRGLRRLIDSHRNLTEYDAAGDCFLNMDTPELPSNSLELTATWLASAGVRVVGDVPPRRHCEAAPASLIDEGTVPRSDFSEAWLWRLVTVGSNNSAILSARAPDSITRFEAGAVCVSKTGIAVSPPAVLQVFREFFIHADSPTRLRRGDTTIIRYRLFNYLYESLSVQIQILTDPHLEGPLDLVETACIAARSSIARRVELRARVTGSGRVSVRAKAVSDGNCGNGTARSEVSDEVIIKIMVEPEGVPMQEQKSIMLCGKGSTESSKSEVLWNWQPVKAVPGTESLTVWAVSDATGPLLADADALVVLPRGCGEQNMARLATNLLALSQLDPRSSAASAAREHVARGFTRQLQYIHPTGGFSAFGASDATSSTWLTAFALRYLRRAHQVLWPGLPPPPALDRAERWLISQQMENGCFRNEGQVFHRELRGGLNEEGEIASVALTAYVITSLVEGSSPLPFRVLQNSLSCLRALPMKSKSPARVYAHSLLAYAFMRLRRYEDDLRSTNEASLVDRRQAALEVNEGLLEVMELIKIAKRQGDYMWWETSGLATTIEATGYALLALGAAASAPREHGAAAARWLAAHRGAAGGFVSTQDTLVALEALLAWSSIQPSSPANVSVTAHSGAASRTVVLQPGDKVPEVMTMELAPQLSVGVEGNGCALVQATRAYNTMSSEEMQHKQLSVQMSVHTDGAFDCDVNATSCFCAAVVQACVIWSGSFPEMALLEVSLPGGFGADASRLYSQLQTPDTLLRRIEVTPRGAGATLYLAARAAGSTPRRGRACFALHAVGPRAATRPAHARLYDYYRPSVNDTQMYSIPEDCPPRISHETNQFMTSDNLFNKARSLSDSGEIIITHEFSFEDIPEGIPLEDPLYDNLTRREKDKGDLKHTSPSKNVECNKTYQLIYDKTPDKHMQIAKDNKPHGRDNHVSEQAKEFTKIIIDDKLDLNASDSPLNDNAEVTLTGDDSKVTNVTNITEMKTDPETYNNWNNSMQSKSKFDKAQNAKSLSNIEVPTGANNVKTMKSNTETDHNLENISTQTKYIIDKVQKTEAKSEYDVTTNGEVETFEPHAEVQRSILNTSTEVNLKQSETNVSENEISPTDHRMEIREQQNQNTDNPNLSDFHVIDSEKDLEVPQGIEGPVPAVVLPPQNFVPPSTNGDLGWQGFQAQRVFYFKIDEESLNNYRRFRSANG